jgi:glycosyltransferase involved in cell wall biosynthesis
MRAKALARLAFDGALAGACLVVVLVVWPLRYLRRALPGAKLNSLWAGTPIINMATNAKAERLLGANAKSLVYTTYFITDAFDYDLSKWTRIPVLGRLAPLFVFIWACYFADRCHFYCDRGILPSRGHFAFDYTELYVYRLLGIPVLLWTYGADIRNEQTCRAMGQPNCCSNCERRGFYCVCDPSVAFRKMSRLRSLSTAIFAGVGDMFGYTPGSRDDLFFWPIDLAADNGERYRPYYPAVAKSTPLRIVHASNHRRFKGTNYLIEAVEALSAEGVEIDLVLVEGVPNWEALKIYRSADAIFDQCLMGNYGYFALEAMALGKPVMCFIRKPGEYLLHPEECPIIQIHVNTLKDDLRRLVEHRDELPEIGQRGRNYIEKHFCMKAFADRLQYAYSDLGIVK